MNIQTRGERNNNPGNLRRNSIVWQGMSTTQNDSSFITFISPEMGIRALSKTLLTYFHAHHLDTVSKIISRWAPSNENDTQSYINAVSTDMQVNPDDVLDLDSNLTLEALVKGIIHHENGRVSYEDDVIQSGVDAALEAT